MNAFIEFIREYWKIILTCFLFLVEIVLILIKRKPKSLDDFSMAFNEVLSLVPDFVSAVERPGEGENKKAEVENMCRKILEGRLDRKLSLNEYIALKNKVDAKIEVVLTSPTKKEIENEK